MLEAYRGDHARSVTDLDILAFRFEGAGHDVIRGRGRRPLGGRALVPDTILGCPTDRPDMIVGGVKEGAARLNPAMRDRVVLEVALARFGCCAGEHAADLTRQLLSRGSAVTPAGHAVRMVAFGDAPDNHRQGPWTGGPGAGKTALLELVRQSFCPHVKALPEAASVVFGGGFPRDDDPECRRAAQRAIYYVQRELEVTGNSHNPAIVLCAVDGLAYWPGLAEEFWSALGTTLQRELARYDAVIHLRTPAPEHGYHHENPLRIESAAAAADIDARIAQAWKSHPKRFVVESSSDFLDKAARALEILRAEMPDCCKRHVVPAIRDRYKAGS